MTIPVRRSSKGSERLAAKSLSPLAKHPSRAERLAQGKHLRDGCPRSSNAEWKPPADRPDPVAVVLTVDTFVHGWKPRDLEGAWLPFLDGIGCGNYFADPVFRAALARQTGSAK